VSEIVTVRVSKDLRKRMKQIDIEWSEEIRRFIETRTRQYELLKIIKEVTNDPRRPTSPLDSTQLIREDRDR